MRIVLMISLLITSFAIKADGLDNSFYGGLELQVRNMGIKSSNIGSFSNANFQPHVLAGFNFDKNFGIEGGANICRFKHSGMNFHKTNALHLGVVGFLPLDNKFKLLGGIGGSRIAAAYYNCKLQTKIKKVVPRALLGLHYSLAECLDLRVSVTYEHAHKMKNSMVKAKDSNSYSLGLINTF
jgi:hypothetical protein